jgi:hypothetical protein
MHDSSAIREDARQEEQESRILDATGPEFDDLDHHACILRRIEDLRRATALTTVVHKDEAIIPQEHWEERVLTLERLCDVWKREWHGMSHWEERRCMMEESSQASECDQRAYNKHVEFGLTLLHASQILFSWVEGIRVPNDVASILSLSRRATNVAIVVSIGLERLRVEKDFWYLVKNMQAE